MTSFAPTAQRPGWGDQVIHQESLPQLAVENFANEYLTNENLPGMEQGTEEFAAIRDSIARYMWTVQQAQDIAETPDERMHRSRLLLYRVITQNLQCWYSPLIDWAKKQSQSQREKWEIENLSNSLVRLRSALDTLVGRDPNEHERNPALIDLWYNISAEEVLIHILRASTESQESHDIETDRVTLRDFLKRQQGIFEAKQQSREDDGESSKARCLAGVPKVICIDETRRRTGASAIHWPYLRGYKKLKPKPRHMWQSWLTQSRDRRICRTAKVQITEARKDLDDRLNEVMKDLNNRLAEASVNGGGSTPAKESKRGTWSESCWQQVEKMPTQSPLRRHENCVWQAFRHNYEVAERCLRCRNYYDAESAFPDDDISNVFDTENPGYRIGTCAEACLHSLEIEHSEGAAARND